MSTMVPILPPNPHPTAPTLPPLAPSGTFTSLERRLRRPGPPSCLQLGGARRVRERGGWQGLSGHMQQRAGEEPCCQQGALP